MTNPVRKGPRVSQRTWHKHKNQHVLYSPRPSGVLQSFCCVLVFSRRTLEKKLDYYAFASPLLCGAPPFKVTQDHLGGAFFCQSSAELHVLACSLDTEFCSSRARVLQVFWSSFLVVIVPSRFRSRCGLYTVRADQTSAGHGGPRGSDLGKIGLVKKKCVAEMIVTCLLPALTVCYAYSSSWV